MARIVRARIVIPTVNRNVISTPATFSPTKTTYATSHQRGAYASGVPKIAPR
jgi:hypothetical protein